jgi:hypothetical protein
VASLDNQNLDARKDAYWIILYIYLKKTLGIDISESLVETKRSEGEVTTSTKISQMLKDIDIKQFSFDQGFLECNSKKVSSNVTKYAD